MQIPKANEIWKSKTSGLHVLVHSANNNVVLWINRSLWNFACETITEKFLESMELAEVQSEKLKEDMYIN